MRPGDVVSGWSSDGSRTLCVVTATSRHRFRFGGEAWLLTKEALAECEAAAPSRAAELAVRALVDSQTPYRWHSVTKTEDHGCMQDACDGEPVSWCAEGQGQAWVEVLAVPLNAVEAALDDCGVLR